MSRSARTPAVVAVVLASLVVAGASVTVAGWLLIERTEVGAQLSGQAPVGALEDPDGWTPWAVNDDGAPVRWDPCRPVELVVNPAGAYPGFAEDLSEAVDDVADAAGLDVEIVEEVDERPAGDRELHQPERYGERWAPVLVAAAEPGEDDLPLRDTDRAIAAPVAVGPAGSQVFVSGQVVLNRERDDIAAGSADLAESWGGILRHELGHLLGLDHVDDPDQVMHAHPAPGPVELGDGDRRGLAALGDGDCVEVPPAGPVEVDTRR